MLMELSVQQSLASLRGNYEDASKIRSKIQVLLNVPMRDLLEDELRQVNFYKRPCAHHTHKKNHPL